MATTTTTTTRTALAEQVLNPQTYTPTSFTFDNHLKHTLPTLGAPSKVTRPNCQEFIDSKGKGCPRGVACPYRHYLPQGERSGVPHLVCKHLHAAPPYHVHYIRDRDSGRIIARGCFICKHYQRGLCKKAESCEFAHTFNLRDERECKEFSRYGICPNGDDCTYLHVPPTSDLRRPACPHYARGFCPLGPYCNLHHIKHKKLCPYYLAGFCPNGRKNPPMADRVVCCEHGAHARWIKDEDLNPRKPEVRKVKDPEVERQEQEERENEFYAEMERSRESWERGDRGAGRWNFRSRGRRGGGQRRDGPHGRPRN